jgi:hypothetical protein
MAGFIFGGNSGMSYEQLQRQREVAAALAARGPGAPRNIGEGLSAVGNALAIRGMTKRADAAETAMRGDFDAKWQGIFGGAGQPAPTGLPARGSGRVETMTEGEGIADDAMATLIKMGLTERGLPEHVADGFVMNAADESGFRTDINEINPLVPGSRGGFGLMQWTGPRRVALEGEAARRGVDPSDLQLQLDTIVAELQGPEARAGQSILSTKDAPSAATAIVSDYLRPAPENLSRRAAEYSSGGGYDINALAEVAGSPLASPGQRAVAEALLQQELTRMNPDPMQALELERAQLEVEALRNPQPDLTTTQQEYEMAKSQGFTGTFLDYQTALAEARRDQTTVNNNIPAGVEPLGTEGQILVPDDSQPSGYRVEVAAGSKLDQERADLAATDTRANELAATASEVVTTAASRARTAVAGQNFGSTGTSAAAMLPWTDSAEVVRQVDVLKAQAVASNLQAMRDASPTGGALGQVTAPELKLLADKSGALNPNSPTFLRDLEDYERTLLETIHGREEGRRIFEATRDPVGDDGVPTYNPQTGRWE